MTLNKIRVSVVQVSGCLDHLTFSQDIQVTGGIRMFGSFIFFASHSREVKVGEKARKRSRHLETTGEFRDLQRMDQELQRIALKVF